MNKTTITVPVEKFLWNNRGPDAEERARTLMHIMRLPWNHNMKPVDYFKKIFGRQNYVFQGSQRLWVWERGDWRVYVGNNKGICLEIRQDVAEERWCKIMDDFCSNFSLI